MPGIHALAIWEALRGGGRCARSGSARSSRPASPPTATPAPAGRTGAAADADRPWRLELAACALMEAATAYVPLVAISSRIPRALLGRGPRLPARAAAPARGLRAGGRRHAARAESAEGLPRAARRGLALRAHGAAGPGLRRDPRRRARGRRRRARPGRARRRARAPARRPGRGGRPRPPRCSPAPSAPCCGPAAACERSGAWAELAALAERLDAPVATTYMGKGASRRDHPLSRRLGLRRGGVPGAAARRPTSCSPSARSSAPRRPGSRASPSTGG